MTSPTTQQLEIMRHALGIRQGGEPYRNHFATDPDSQDGALCQELVKLRLMEDRGSQSLAGGMHFYIVTESGKQACRIATPPEKLTRSQRRYRKWLQADTGHTFREWLGIRAKRSAAR